MVYSANIIFGSILKIIYIKFLLLSMTKKTFTNMWGKYGLSKQNIYFYLFHRLSITTFCMKFRILTTVFVQKYLITSFKSIL